MAKLNDGLIICQYLKENGFDASAVADKVSIRHIDSYNAFYDVQIWPGRYVCVCTWKGYAYKQFEIPRIESPNYIEELKEFITTFKEYWRQNFDQDKGVSQVLLPIPLYWTE